MQRTRILIFRRTNHAGIAIVQHVQMAHADFHRRAAHFRFTHLPQRFGRRVCAGRDFAHLAARRAQDAGIHALPRVFCQQTANALFIVRMSIDCHERK